MLNPQKAKSGPKAAVDMSKQIGHFQDEGKRVWFRNVRIRELD